MQFEGGEAAALERLQHYTWGSDAVTHYFETRNGALPRLSLCAASCASVKLAGDLQHD